MFQYLISRIMKKTDPIFVHARTTGGALFESYQDYWTMVNLSNYPTCELSEIDYTDPSRVYIWSSPIGKPQQVFENEQARNRKCKLVMWFLEWPKWEEGKLLHLDGLADPVDEIWVSDRYLYTLFQRFVPAQAHKCKFLVLGGHPDFGVKEPINEVSSSTTKTWDFCHLMYLTGVRGDKFYTIQQKGFRMAPTTFVEAERDHTLRHSRWGLNLHQNSLACLSPQRFMIFASYRLPIITDYCVDPSPFVVFQDALIHWDPRKSSVMNDEIRTEAVEANYKMVTETHSFKAEVDRLVKESDLLHSDIPGVKWKMAAFL